MLPLTFQFTFPALTEVYVQLEEFDNAEVRVSAILLLENLSFFPPSYNGASTRP